MKCSNETQFIVTNFHSDFTVNVLHDRMESKYYFKQQDGFNKLYRKI